MSVEAIKLASNGLRGALPIELLEPSPAFSEEVKQLLKFHGIYQQHDRDIRGREKHHSFMIRSKVPGGRLTALQYLLHDALADEFGQSDLRLTTRQAIQLHGIIKSDLKETLKKLNDVLVTTLGACGDVVRNIMYCPAPYGDPVRVQLQALAERLADHLAPRTPAYHSIWLEDETGKNVPAPVDLPEVDEPMYGKTYLPRKFKVALAFPGDNCTDIFTNDIGLIGLFDETTGELHGVNFYVGGGLGSTHGKEETFPRLADPLGYVPLEHVVEVAEKVILVQRDFGDRENRRHARMKYLIHDWGIARFKAKVEEYLGDAIAPERPMPALGVDDHMGWHEQIDGNWFYGIYVENGRVKDDGGKRMRSGLRAIIQQLSPQVIVTAQQNIILGGIAPAQKSEVERLMQLYGIPPAEAISQVRRNAMACPALPTCSLAIAEAERFLPSVIDQVEEDLSALGLEQEQFTIRMTGCPNGCARPYVADIGIVGRSGEKYSVYFGGNPEGTRLNELFADLVPAANLRTVIRGVLEQFVAGRQSGERLAEYVARVGVAALHVHPAP